MSHFTRVFVRPGTVCPLDDQALNSEYHIQSVAEPREAQWIVASSIRFLTAYSIRYPFKHFLYYTNEPRHSHLTTKTYRAAPLLPKIEIMNGFTGDVFWNNFHFLGSYHFDPGNNLDIDLQAELGPISKVSPILDRQKTAATFFTYRLGDKRSPCAVDGVDRDLEVTRCTYALALHRAGLCDVYGGGWPRGVSRGTQVFSQHIPHTAIGGLVSCTFFLSIATICVLKTQRQTTIARKNCGTPSRPEHCRSIGAEIQESLRHFLKNHSSI